ncbi:unnamed protein product [Pleuronectes platessa]|uniref:Uncharacterized protein n=1 Tax=Pleuronectes platessa TaxID=8262 RepID=A0A9N7ZC76_PLEPL|nr:unnamed protein product [Pleuronectes platessa]
MLLKENDSRSRPGEQIERELKTVHSPSHRRRTKALWSELFPGQFDLTCSLDWIDGIRKKRRLIKQVPKVTVGDFVFIKVIERKHWNSPRGRDRIKYYSQHPLQ